MSDESRFVDFKADIPEGRNGHGIGIINFRDHFPDRLEQKGVGIPCHALSTNCLYYEAYVLADKMSTELGESLVEGYAEKAEKMKKAINEHFWMEDKGYYRYIVDDFGGCDYQEGMGLAFVLLFDIADEDRKKRVLDNMHITPQGVACLWPEFPRYRVEEGKTYGRHCGTIWPHIEAFFADAALKCGRKDIFENEVKLMAKRATRDGMFAEIYHPDTGVVYGGIQERYGMGMVEWESVVKQTWSATGFIRMILFDIIGIKVDESGMSIKPNLIDGIEILELKNLYFRSKLYNISIDNNGKVTMQELKNVFVTVTVEKDSTATPLFV